MEEVKYEYHENWTTTNFIDSKVVQKHPSTIKFNVGFVYVFGTPGWQDVELSNHVHTGISYILITNISPPTYYLYISLFSKYYEGLGLFAASVTLL